MTLKDKKVLFGKEAEKLDKKIAAKSKAKPKKKAVKKAPAKPQVEKETKQPEESKEPSNVYQFKKMGGGRTPKHPDFKSAQEALAWLRSSDLSAGVWQLYIEGVLHTNVRKA